MRQIPAYAAAALMIVALCAGQTRPPAAHQPQTSAAPSRNAAARPVKPDKEIEAIIRAKFAKSKINADKFTVHVQGGVATIEGHTGVLQHKGVATRLAKSGGALAVNNHIEASDAAKKKAADNLEEGRRRVQVTRGEPRSDASPARTSK